MRLRVTRGKDDFDSRPYLGDLFHQLLTVHFRHDHVGKQQVYRSFNHRLIAWNPPGSHCQINLDRKNRRTLSTFGFLRR